MANAEKRLDDKLKAANPAARKAKKSAGPKYLQGAPAASPSVGKAIRPGKTS